VVDSVIDLQDKGKGAVLMLESTLTHLASKEIHAKIIMSLFIRGIGGFGYKGTHKIKFPKMPKREPDHVAVEVT